jgi:uncharacterized membrane protein
MLRRSGRRADDGQLTVLIIGFVFIGAVLVVAGIDVSKVFLARRALSSVADSAALAAAQSVDRAALYRGSGGCGQLLPLDPTGAQSQVATSLTDDVTDLQQTFATLDQPEVVVTADTVTVHLSGAVHVPFGSVLSLLHVGGSGGSVDVGVSASAQSPVSAPDGC